MDFLTSFISASLLHQASALAITLAYAMVLPILWLVFCLWLNRNHPRRAGILSGVFLLGALAVMVTLPVEKYIATLSTNTTALTIMWAASEELLKFAAFMFVAYRASRFNGPRDYPLVAVTAGLGFAGLENALYILQPVMVSNVTQAALSGSMRFLGADLLHGVTMSMVGLALGFAYFKSGKAKALYATIGLAVGVVIHSIFNLLVVNADQQQSLHIFAGLWILTILSVVFWILLARMEKPNFIQTVWSGSIGDTEAAFLALMTKLGVSADNTRTMSEIFAEKGLGKNSSDYAEFQKTRDCLLKNYALHLRSQGLSEEDATKSAAAVVTEGVSPKTVSTLFGVLKEKSALVLGNSKIEVFAKAE